VEEKLDRSKSKPRNGALKRLSVLVARDLLYVTFLLFLRKISLVAMWGVGVKSVKDGKLRRRVAV